MAVHVKVGGVWKQASSVYEKVSGTWKQAIDMPIKVSGVWKTGTLIQGAYESIATATGTGSSGTITFTSIPSTYKHLQIRFRAFANSENPAMYIRLNSDSGTNYSWHYLYGNGTSVGSTGAATQAQMRIADYGVMSNATYPTVAIIDLIDYASTSKYKTVRTFLGTDKNNTNSQGVELVSGLWRSTSAVSSISLTVDGANFTSTSTFALYGIKGA